MCHPCVTLCHPLKRCTPFIYRGCVSVSAFFKKKLYKEIKKVAFGLKFLSLLSLLSLSLLRGISVPSPSPLQARSENTPTLAACGRCNENIMCFIWMFRK